MYRPWVLVGRRVHQLSNNTTTSIIYTQKIYGRLRAHLSSHIPRDPTTPNTPNTPSTHSPASASLAPPPSGICSSDAQLGSAQVEGAAGGEVGRKAGSRWLKKYLELSRWRLTRGVALSSGVVMFAVTPSALALLLNPAKWLSLIGGVTLMSASTSAINQVMETKFDALMRRTANRPVVSGHISSQSALAFGAVTSGMGLGLLWYMVNPITAALGAATAASYLFVYTPMKRMTAWNTEVGAVIGSLPVLMGATATLGEAALTDPQSLLLFTIQTLWQMDHFMHIVHERHSEYLGAGFVMRENPLQHKKIYEVLLWALPVAWFACTQEAGFLLLGTAVNGAYFAGSKHYNMGRKVNLTFLYLLGLLIAALASPPTTALINEFTGKKQPKTQEKVVERGQSVKTQTEGEPETVSVSPISIPIPIPTSVPVKAVPQQ